MDLGRYIPMQASGTSMMHRDSQIKDCKKGLIDLILVKSVSICEMWSIASTVEMLLGLRPPVRVIFESENIDTAKTESVPCDHGNDGRSESRNKSDIMKWSQHRNSIGRFMTPGFRV